MTNLMAKWVVILTQEEQTLKLSKKIKQQKAMRNDTFREKVLKI